MSEYDIKEKISFRYATKEDIKTIAALEPLIFSDPWTEEMVRADVEARISRYIIAEMEDETGDGKPRVVGYLGYWLVFDECSINNVAVVPELQGHGIGNMLMDRVIEETERFGASVWVLEVRAGNDAAIALYKKHDFTNVGTRRGYYENGEDAIMMHRIREQ
ncbi:MAG: ribosomal protein S18-alanine N-acetyltransferase [Firmicutes bacterium]|nr:ribosomal protein S18-alanine N-acetyltransferase [Bacillota bacterium]